MMQAWCQNNSIPVYSINQTNLYETLPKLRLPGWLKDWIKGDVLAGYTVVAPDRYVTIERWHGIGWAMIDPYSGLGAYYILGGLGENTSLGYKDIRAGGSGTIPTNFSISGPGAGGDTRTINKTRKAADGIGDYWEKCFKSALTAFVLTMLGLHLPILTALICYFGLYVPEILLPICFLLLVHFFKIEADLFAHAIIEWAYAVKYCSKPGEIDPNCEVCI
jgi:hypothetical protein